MPSTESAPLWLRSSRITGLDQLGIQVVSIALYSELLPGLTNVTDRVRYYSFYPWVLHRYAKDVRRAGDKPWQEHLRRADFLLALVAHAHHPEDKEGGEAVVGSNMAAQAVQELRQNPSIQRPISTWSYLPAKGKEPPYFKNKEGGFGQYYKTTLAELGLVETDDGAPGVHLVRGRGTQIAAICDAQPARDAFWRAVLADKISFNEAEQLGKSLCPCLLPTYPAERDFLRELLFGAPGEMTPRARRRANSLRLLLAFLNQFGGEEDPWHSFRQTAYYRHGRSGKRLLHPADLEETLERWGVYQAGEYVNRALEELFLALLTKLHAGPVDVDHLADEFTREILSRTSTSLGLGTDTRPWGERLLSDLLEEAGRDQGAAGEWPNRPWSEEQLISRAQAAKDPGVKAALSLGCILSVLARGSFPEDPYAKFKTLGIDFKGRHPVSLESVAKVLRDREAGRAAAVTASLLKDMVLFQHLRVAMRKLRYQAQSTFKLVVEEDRYFWVEDFKPTFTSPRIRQAFRFLRDLGLCRGRSGRWQLTADGKALLGGADGH